ncbi:sigma-54 interaction domain-containing protein [Sinanaerobacter chloroacetimidivorans]|uniref:Sigma 54-interacting transcriptional regulator n=1 Tax=Sinanaerobacter chloroacetimidivorans TaxID=2818044 RepID=A0A8J7W311_9FIRM|nr:sigma 54-interacting transcriptional regulator [Sinanaerobacter chloroacetimidivorans]MBR0599554.1 sigma 54-interacting transcriptional regulator [Sinanaerobacter chloroacetimidivorans]
MKEIKAVSSEVELLEQIDIFQTAFESSYDGIHILDSAGNTLYINKACERIEGITMKDAYMFNIREMVDQGIYSESVTLKVLETNAAATIIQKVKNGNTVLATGTPIYKDGKIDKIVVNSRDVTELNFLRKALSEKEELTEKYQEEIRLLRLESLKNLGFISKSPNMEKIKDLAVMVAKVDSTVLISGESGVGKGVLSKYIHRLSSRKEGPFIKIDCSAIPESLFESEVFGYEKGAFTGAEKSGKVGLLELANGGTVFLDEIGDMPLHLQPKLLRAIQDREIVRVGGKQAVSIDVRFISATNGDLKQMVKDKTFRPDLYYRLNVVPIFIPPLRERREDMIPLIQDITEKINSRYNLDKKISKQVIEMMLQYDWPGNVRELENIIERMMVTEEDEFGVLQNLIGKKEQAGSAESYRQKLEEYDKKLLLDCIKEKGSVLRAAEVLGMDPTTMRRKLHKYKVPKAYWAEK